MKNINLLINLQMQHIIRLLTISIFFLTIQSSFGQITSTYKKMKKPYIVWVKPIDNTSTIKGYLNEVSDTLVIKSLLKHKAKTYIGLNNIEYLKYRRKGKTGQSIAIGGLAGFAVGAIIYMSVLYEPCSTKSSFCFFSDSGVVILSGGTLGIIPGLIIGGIVGGRKKIIIPGSSKSIKAQKEKLNKIKMGYDL